MKDKELKKIEINIMALLMKKGYNNKGLPKEELTTLTRLTEEYSDEYKLIKEGKNPHKEVLK